MRPRRAVRTQLARLGADTVAQLRATFPGKTVDDAVRSLLESATSRRSDRSDGRISANRNGLPIDSPTVQR